MHTSQWNTAEYGTRSPRLEKRNLFENRWTSVQVSFASGLPSERVSDDPPLTHEGIDFFGPVNVGGGNSGEDKSCKVYTCLFTCASTGAVHLELCRRLNAQDFLLALRRFAGRRGLPATWTSDNARTFKSFKSSSKEIRRITRPNEVLRYLVN